MLTFLIAFFVSMTSIAFIPFLRRTLHPLEILSCGLMIASLEQFSYAVLTLNLQLVKASENPFLRWQEVSHDPVSSKKL